LKYTVKRRKISPNVETAARLQLLKFVSAFKPGELMVTNRNTDRSLVRAFLGRMSITFTVLLTMAAQAGTKDGGGNATASRQASPDDIEQILREIKAPTVFALHNLEAMTVGIDLGTGLPYPNLMFRGKRTVYDALSEAKIQVVDDSCFDRTGLETDGSAINGLNLCFSKSRLAKKLKLVEAERELIALVAHEAAHLVGVDEIGAQQVQAIISKNLSFDPISHINGIAGLFRSRLSSILQTITFVQVTAPTAKSSQICPSLMAMNLGFSDLLGILANGQKLEGVLVPSVIDTSKIYNSALRAVNTLSYCQDGDSFNQLLLSGYKDVSQLAQIQAEFGSNPETKLQNLIPRNSTEKGIFRVTGGIVKRITAGSIPALVQEIQEITSSLQQVSASLKVPQPSWGYIFVPGDSYHTMKDALLALNAPFVEQGLIGISNVTCRFQGTTPLLLSATLVDQQGKSTEFSDFGRSAANVCSVLMAKTNFYGATEIRAKALKCKMYGEGCLIFQ
jgi:hypothetical protein